MEDPIMHNLIHHSGLEGNPPTNNLLRALGQFKYRAMRLAGYVTIFNTVLLVVALGWRWWYLLAVAGIVIAYFFEKKYAIPGEQDVGWGASSEWQKFKAEWQEFRENQCSPRKERGE
jgi:hypothetical protein